MQLGRLKKIPVRSIWTSEANEFTPWLAKDENIELLGDALGLRLELEATEAWVGPFRADILCKDIETENWVLIENQLERTDHKHLGQLLTYAAGLQAATIVWIAPTFNEEHRATLDWLNKITDENFQFFGLEIEIWSIGESDAAPKFNVVSKPNSWSETTDQAAKHIALEAKTELEKTKFDFWNEFSSYMRERSNISTHRPTPRSWLKINSGRASTWFAAVINSRQDSIGFELYLTGRTAKYFFDQLNVDREQIDSKLGFNVDWQPLHDRTACRIIRIRENSPINLKENWKLYIEWLFETAQKFRYAFRQPLKNLNALPESDFQEEDLQGESVV